MPKPTSDCRATERKHPWPMVRLGDVCGTINGIWKGLRKPFVHVGIIRSSNMTKNCEFSLDKTIYIDVEEKKYKQRKLLAGDIIVERSGGGPGQPVGRAVYFDLEDGEYSVSNFTSILRVKDANALNGKFLQLYLTSQYFQGATENIQSNTTGLHNLDFDAYLNFDVPLPPLSEQKEIVARLERELATVEKMKKGFEALAETAKAEFKAELKEVFEELKHRGTEPRKLGDVCELIKDGEHKTPRRVESYCGYYLLSARNVKDDNLALEDVDYVDKEEFERIARRCRPIAGDVLISCSGSVGRVCVAGDAAYVMVRSAAMVRASKFDSRFLMFMLQSDWLQKQIAQLQRQAAQANLFLGAIAELNVHVPPLSVQREVVARLDAAKARAEKLEAKARAGMAVCEAMRKAILKEAFDSGR